MDADSAHSRFLPTTIRPPLRVAWSRPVPVAYGPIVAAGTVIYASDGQKVAAVSTQDGHVLGTDTYGQLSPNFAFADGQGLLLSDNGNSLLVRLRPDGTEGYTQSLPQQFSPPSPVSLGGSLVVTASNNGDEGPPSRLLTLDAATGRTVAARDLPTGLWGITYDFTPSDLCLVAAPRPWLFAMGGPSGITFDGGPGGRMIGLRYGCASGYCKPAGGRDCLYLTCQSDVQCLDRRLKQKWVVHLPDYTGAGGRIGDVPVVVYYPPAVTPRVLVLYDGLHLLGLSPRTGRRVWAARASRLPRVPSFAVPAPVATGSVVYVVTPSRAGGPGDTLVAFSLAAGKKLWSQKVGHRLDSIIAHRGALYLGDDASPPNRPSTAGRSLVKLVPAAMH